MESNYHDSHFSTSKHNLKLLSALFLGSSLKPRENVSSTTVPIAQFLSNELWQLAWRRVPPSHSTSRKGNKIVLDSNSSSVVDKTCCPECSTEKKKEERKNSSAGLQEDNSSSKFDETNFSSLFDLFVCGGLSVVSVQPVVSHTYQNANMKSETATKHPDSQNVLNISPTSFLEHWTVKSSLPTHLHHKRSIRAITFDESVGTNISDGSQEKISSNGLSNVLLSTRLAVASFDGTASIWEIDKIDSRPNGIDWEFRGTLSGHESEVKSVSFAPVSSDVEPGESECMIATCSRDKTVWIFGLEEEKDEVNRQPEDKDNRQPDDKDNQEPLVTGYCITVLTNHTQDVKSVRFHPFASILVSASYDESVKIWKKKEFSSSSQKKNSERPADSNLLKRISEPLSETELDELICSTGDNETDWDISQTLTNHKGTVWEVCFSPRGWEMVSCSEDGCLCIYSCINPVFPLIAQHFYLSDRNADRNQSGKKSETDNVQIEIDNKKDDLCCSSTQSGVLESRILSVQDASPFIFSGFQPMVFGQRQALTPLFLHMIQMNIKQKKSIIDPPTPPPLAGEIIPATPVKTSVGETDAVRNDDRKLCEEDVDELLMKASRCCAVFDNLSNSCDRIPKVYKLFESETSKWIKTNQLQCNRQELGAVVSVDWFTRILPDRIIEDYIVAGSQDDSIRVFKRVTQLQLSDSELPNVLETQPFILIAEMQGAHLGDCNCVRFYPQVLTSLSDEVVDITFCNEEKSKERILDSQGFLMIASCGGDQYLRIWKLVL